MPPTLLPLLLRPPPPAPLLLLLLFLQSSRELVSAAPAPLQWEFHPFPPQPTGGVLAANLNSFDNNVLVYQEATGNTYQHFYKNPTGDDGWNLADCSGSEDGQAPPKCPGARIGAAMATLDLSPFSSVALFGGLDKTGVPKADTWLYSYAWVDKTEELGCSAVQPCPSARYGHAMSPYGPFRVFLYGGITRENMDPTKHDAKIGASVSSADRHILSRPSVISQNNDAWVLFFNKNSLVLHWQRVPAPPPQKGIAFASRAFHAMYALPIVANTAGNGRPEEHSPLPLIVVFGGCEATSSCDSTHQCDRPVNVTTITYTGRANSSSDRVTGEWRSAGVKPAGPSARFGAAMSLVEGDTRSLIMFGGCTTKGCDPHNASPKDTWRLTYDSTASASVAWAKQKAPGKDISGRSKHGMVSLRPTTSSDTKNEDTTATVLIISGIQAHENLDTSPQVNLSKTWQLEGAGTKWDDITTLSSPGPRDSLAMSSASSGHAGSASVVLVGGAGTDPSQKTDRIENDTWVLRPPVGGNESYSWKKLKGEADPKSPAISPPPRKFSAMANVDSVSQAIFLFGGQSERKLLGDTWMYALGNQGSGNDRGLWYNISIPDGAPRPKARHYHAMSSLGDQSGRVLLFGGSATQSSDSNPDRFLDDTWIYAPAAVAPGSSAPLGRWKQIKRSGRALWPSGRNGHDMATISPARVAMFGGQTGQPVRAGSYCLSAETWIFVAAPPPVDSTLSSSSSPSSSLGGQWQRLEFDENDAVPQRRQGHTIESMGRGKIVMFGGCTGNSSCSTLLSDTWLLTQTHDPKSGSVQINAHGAATFVVTPRVMLVGAYKWYHLTPSAERTPPAPRAQHSLAYVGGVTGQVLLFGGQVHLTYTGIVERKKAGDSWFLSDGCPPGTYDVETNPEFHKGTSNLMGDYGCYPCEAGTYKPGNGLDHAHCQPCPKNVITSEPGGKIDKRDCDVCLNPYGVTPGSGSCTVNSTTYEPVWTCTTEAWGPDCREACDCNHGTCNSSVHGNGACTCPLLHTLNLDGKCKYPVFLVLVILLVTAVIFGVVKLRNKYRQRIERTEEQGWMRERELEDGHMAEIGALQEGWRVWEDDLTFRERIASGAMGEVWKGTWAMLPERDVAIKKMFIRMEDVMTSASSSSHRNQSSSLDKRNAQIERRLERRREKKRRAREKKENTKRKKAKAKEKKRLSSIKTGDSKDGKGGGTATTEYHQMNDDNDDDDGDDDTGDSRSQAGASSKARRLYGFSTTTQFDDRADQAAFSDKEIALLSRTRHRRVVLFHGAGQLSTGQLFLVTEFMHGGDLRSALDRSLSSMVAAAATADSGNGPLLLSWRKRVSIAKDIAEGMAFLHGRQLLHRDLKSLNVLLDVNGRAKIADFGLSRVSSRQRQSIASYRASFVSSGGGGVEEKGRGDGDGWDAVLDSVAYTPAEMTGRQGTAAWMAPELEPMRRESQERGDPRGGGVEYSFGVDCYSFGIVLFEIITCRHPWQDLRFSAQIIDRVVAGERPSISSADEEACKLAGCGWMLALMRICWAQDPRRRPPFAEVFRKIDQCSKVLGMEETAFTSMGRQSYDGSGGRTSRANSSTESTDIELSLTSLSSGIDSMHGEVVL